MAYVRDSFSVALATALHHKLTKRLKALRERPNFIRFILKRGVANRQAAISTTHTTTYDRDQSLSKLKGASADYVAFLSEAWHQLPSATKDITQASAPHPATRRRAYGGGGGGGGGCGGGG